MKKIANIFLIILLIGVVTIFQACTSQHNFSDEWSYNEVYHYHECTDENCTVTSDKESHTFDSGVVIKESTFTEQGEIKYTCECGYSYTEKLPLKEKQTGVIENISDLSKVYDGTAVSGLSYTANSDGNVTIMYKVYGQSDTTYTTVAPINAGKYVVKIAIDEGTETLSVTATKVFTISKADLTFNEQIILTGVYSSNQTLNDFSLEGYVGLSWKDSDIIPTVDNTSYVAIYNPDSNNYNDLEVIVTINLSKAAPTYSVPDTISGISGDTLGQIDITKYNFKWDDETTIVNESGNYSATYIPDDLINYDIVSGVMIYIKVVNNVIEVPTIDKTFVYSGSENVINIDDIVGFNADYMQIDYENSVLSAVNAGEYKIVIKLKDSSENCWADRDTADKILTWTIQKADTSFEKNIILNAVYSSKQTLNDISTTNDFVIWKNPDIVPTADVTTYAAIYNPDKNNFNDYEFSITIIVAKADPVFTIPSNLTGYDGNELSSVELPANMVWVNGNLIISRDTTTYRAKYIPSDTINYNEAEFDVTINVLSDNYDFTITYVSGTKDNYIVTTNDSGEYIITFNTITAKTVYSISGELVGGIVINVGDDYKFELILDGVSITSESTSPIIILSGDKVTVTAEENTQSYITDKRSAVTDDTQYSSCVYSLVDLTLGGKGSLTVVSQNNNGIHTKDDLEVKNITLSVDCKDNALKGNDSVTITSGNITLIARQGDGIKTSNSKIKYESDGVTIKKIQGIVSITGGNITIYSACDGIDAAYNVEISGSPVINIYTDKYSQYSEEVTSVSSSTYYIRNTSSGYKYSIYYYNSETGSYVWKNSSSYTMVRSNRGYYYYYEIEKPSGYTNLIVYMYSGSQSQGQSTSYYKKSSTYAINDNNTLAYSSNSGTFTWTNYTTTSMGGGMGPSGMNEGNPDKGDYSTKGLKADNEIIISGGTINIKSYDDSIHTNNDVVLGDEDDSTDDYYGTGNITITGGTITLYSNDDGIHADQDLIISDSAYVKVEYSYEGIEANRIYFNGGTTYVYAKNDAVNAAQCNGKYTPLVTITDGYIDLTTPSGDTDTMDSNGDIKIMGGTVVLKNGQTNGTSMTGGTIDLDGTLTITGGNVISIGCWCSEANMNADAYSTSTTLSSGTYTIKNSSGNIIATFELTSSYKGYRIYCSNLSGTYYLYNGTTQITTIK